MAVVLTVLGGFVGTLAFATSLLAFDASFLTAASTYACSALAVFVAAGVAVSLRSVLGISPAQSEEIKAR